jgi:biotin transport system substrate-specific component
MSDTSTTQATLANVLWPASMHNLARMALLAIAGTALLTLSAKIQVPFYPVPMTMQTFAIMVIAMAFGWKLGAATVVLYLLEGAFGLPVFAGTPAKGIGIAYMTGPTGGYLLGFFLAAGLTGWLAQRGWDRNVVTTLAAMVAGTAVIYLFGFAWLSTLIGAAKAWQFGVFPFLLGDAFKIALAAALMPLLWRVVARAKP